ncbi:hypothetical protein KC19_12G034400 [Ceratodon purpureus]|uniref:Uncharacterized protein n=1 Tax=Ceratodon purpureus TaxID=3225 RepID=A0A8T0G5M2_CERPU|nr:hypothetical protein KC19_12G034400 [Ceratodon purpureus]
MSSGRLRVEKIVGFVCGEVLGLHLGFLLFRCHHTFVCSCVCARKNTQVPRRIVVLHRLRRVNLWLLKEMLRRWLGVTSDGGRESGFVSTHLFFLVRESVVACGLVQLNVALVEGAETYVWLTGSFVNSDGGRHCFGEGFPFFSLRDMFVKFLDLHAIWFRHVHENAMSLSSLVKTRTGV